MATHAEQDLLQDWLDANSSTPMKKTNDDNKRKRSYKPDSVSNHHNSRHEHNIWRQRDEETQAKQAAEE